MRDHNNGHDHAVMGGMWGAVGNSADILSIVKGALIAVVASTSLSSPFLLLLLLPTVSPRQHRGHVRRPVLLYEAVMALHHCLATWSRLADLRQGEFLFCAAL